MKRVDRVSAGLARQEDVADLDVDRAPRTEPVQAVVRERRPALHDDEDQHRRRRQQDGANERTEQPPGALICPGRAHQWWRVFLFVLGFGVLLKTETPPELLMIVPAATLVRAQSMNFVTFGSEPAV